MDWTAVFQLLSGIGISSAAAGAAIFTISKLLAKYRVDKALEQFKADYGRQLEELRHEGAAIIENIKIKGSKDILIYKIQFEKEFEVYLKLWSSAVILLRDTARLRPIFDQIDPSQSEEQRKQERLINFDKAQFEFADVVGLHRPFYAPTVFDISNELIKICSKEAISYKHRDPYKNGYWEEVDENIKNIINLIDKLCLAIRERIFSVSII